MPADGVLVGVNLDWGSDSPDAFDRRLGRTPAVWVQFVGFPFSPEDRTNLAGFVDAVAAQHGTALLTVEPNAGLAAVDEAAIADLVTVVAAANDAGVPVLVRFAHEMNGSWYAWGEQPAAYVAAFRRLAGAVHAGTTDAAMLWAPNDGGGYPFAGGRYEAKPGTSDFALLDTNEDGQLSMDDDPYGPYYPGDEAVDWVGMSLYHWGDRWPWGRNVLPEDGKFAAKLTGTYDGTAGDERALPDFYTTYAVEHGKPMAIPETAAFYRPDARAGAAELPLKRAWWRQVFSTSTLEQFPQVRLIDWFDQRKFETEVDDVVDWRLTGEARVASAFLADLPPAFRFASPTP
ncbi:MAG TPA: glycosyl hydrolase [Candidatus Limnocylindrales bacterium]